MGDKSFKRQSKPLLNSTVQGNFKQAAPAPSIFNRRQLGKDIDFIEELITAQDIGEAADAIPRSRGGGLSADLSTLPGSSSSRSDAERRIGGATSGMDTPNDKTGFDDPLAGHRNRRRGSLVGPGRVPSGNDLVGQYFDTPASSDMQSDNGADGRAGRRTPARVERHTERTSADGLDTWGSTLYRDDAGNHWRSDQHTQRSADGSVTTTDTIYDSRGEAIKTTVVEVSPYGVEIETTTNHRTGETRTVDITPKEAPEPAPEAPEKYQPAEGSPQGDPIAPRGWSNPVTGAVHNPGLKTGNNKVNPNPEDSQPPLKPLRLDPKDIVINPAPDAPLHGGGAPRDIRREEADINIIDPPKPTS